MTGFAGCVGRIKNSKFKIKNEERHFDWCNPQSCGRQVADRDGQVARATPKSGNVSVTALGREVHSSAREVPIIFWAREVIALIVENVC
jgi:hypothetical protein